MYLSATGHNWRSLDILGYVWTVPGHLVLGKCWLATPVDALGQVMLMEGPGIEVVGVREQLGGQGVLCIEVCCCHGVGRVPPNHPLVGE